MKTHLLILLQVHLVSPCALPLHCPVESSCPIVCTAVHLCTIRCVYSYRHAPSLPCASHHIATSLCTVTTPSRLSMYTIGPPFGSAMCIDVAFSHPTVLTILRYSVTQHLDCLTPLYASLIQYVPILRASSVCSVRRSSLSRVRSELLHPPS